MGLFTDEANNVINQSIITYKIMKCQNSTQNNNSCASNEDIAQLLKYVSIQATIPKSVYDFNNIANPRKRTYDYQYYHLDYNLLKWFSGTLMPVYLETDVGIIYDEYKEDSVDYNVENLQYETNIRNENDNILFQYDLYFGYDQLIYYRRNQKIYIFIANFGGIINIFFLFGKIICSFYNHLVFLHELINIAFENLDKKSGKTK